MMVFCILSVELNTFYQSFHFNKTTISTIQSNQTIQSNVQTPDDLSSIPKTEMASKASLSVSHSTTTLSESDDAFLSKLISYLCYIITGICGALSIFGIDSCIAFASRESLVHSIRYHKIHSLHDTSRKNIVLRAYSLKQL